MLTGTPAARESAVAIPVLLTFVVLAACKSDSPADDTHGSDGATAAIAAAMSQLFPASPDGGPYEDPNCGDLEPETEAVDLDGDGDYEVFMHWGNTCTSGGAGRSLSLLIRNEAGVYVDQFGFPGMGYTLGAAGVDGYPQIEIGGPGFCASVWAWNGDAYEFSCLQPHMDGACEGRGKLCLDVGSDHDNPLKNKHIFDSKPP